MSDDKFKERIKRGLWYFGVGMSLVGLGRIITKSDDKIFKESLSFLIVGSLSKIIGIYSTISGAILLATNGSNDSKKDLS